MISRSSKKTARVTSAARTFKPPRGDGYGRWAVLGAVLGLLGALVCFAPARWLAAGVQSLSAGRVQLVQARGTIWQGSAQLHLTGGADSVQRTTLPDRVHWEWVWRGAPGVGVRLHSPCCTREAWELRFVAGWKQFSVQVQEGQSSWPAGLLTGLGAPWNTLQLQGQVQLNTPGLRLQWVQGRWQITGQAQVQMIHVSTRLSTLQPLGSYEFVLQGGDVPTLALKTLEGALLLSGAGQWVGSKLRFEGQAQAAPENEAALANLLNIIGRRNGARSLITLG